MKKNIFIVAIGLALWGCAAGWLAPRYQVPILMYHAVEASWFEPLNNVRPVNFSRQLAYIHQQGYQVITLAALVDRIKKGQTLDRRSVVITFDDGYENNYTQAYPLLVAYGFPADIFVEVAKLGAADRLTWAQVEEMADHGMTFGSHTLTGVYMPDITPQKAAFEVRESKRLMEYRLGRQVLFFSYPIGGFTPLVKKDLKDAGYAAAVTTNRGEDHRAKDLYELKRIRVKDEDSGFVLWFKLSGYYNLFRAVKNSF